MMPQQSVRHETYEHGEGDIPLEAASPVSIENVGEKRVVGHKVEKAKRRFGKRQPLRYYNIDVTGSNHWVPSQRLR